MGMFLVNWPGRGARLLPLAIVVGTLGGCGVFRSNLAETVLKTPVTVEQHHSLAANFAKRRDDARSLAAYHVALAAQYRSADADLGEEASEMAAHCEALAEDYETIAARYEALAAGHAGHADAPNRTLHLQEGDDRSVQDGP